MKQLIILLALLSTYPVYIQAQDSKLNRNTPQKQQSGNKSKYDTKTVSGKNTTKNSQYEALVDTLIVSPDGSSLRYSSYTFIGDTAYYLAPFMMSIAPTHARRNFEQTQQQVLQQVDEDAVRFNRWMEQQVTLHNEKIRQQLRAQKVALFIEIMNLTPEESERFWPIYNEFTDKRDQIMSKRQDITAKLRRADLSIDDRQAEALSKEYVNSLTQEADLQQEYYKKYRTILKPSKLLMIYKAEDAFKLMMLQNRIRMD